MTITHDTFRRAEAMLLAASIPGADALTSVIALALETMAPPPHLDDAGVPEPVTISVAELAERLGWAQETIETSLVHASEELRDILGFRLFSHEAAEGEESVYTGTSTPTRVRLAGQLTSILHGRALRCVARDDPQALTVDTKSMAMLDLVACCSETGGAFLLREAEVADERDAELKAIAATIADHHRIVGEVVVAGTLGQVEDRISPAAAILSAVLHGASVLLLTDVLFDPPAEGVDEDSFDDVERASRRKVRTWQPTAPGERTLHLLPHVPIAVLIPVPRDIVLSPRTASCFVTAIGPLRRDRGAAVATMQKLAGGRLGDAVAERLVDLWDGRSDLARTSLGAVDRMIEGPLPRASWRRRKRAIRPDDDERILSCAYSTTVEAMAVGIAPHVWAPIKRQNRPPPRRFHRELFVSEPSEAFLFSERLRQISGVRILLSGVPGTGKTMAAAHVAEHVLGMKCRDLRMSEVLFHRLGALERAIAGAFREAREEGAVLIVDEADSIAQDRGSASPNAFHLVTAMTNSLLLEFDRHDFPVVLCTNYADRLDPAIRRRMDLAFEVKALPEDRETLAFRLLLELDPPGNFPEMGETVVSDYVAAARVLQLQGGGAEAAREAIVRARNVRLGRHETKGRRKIGF